MNIKHDYGQTPTELAKKYKVSRQTVHRWYRDGKLDGVISTGQRPAYQSQYRRKYGLTMEQIAKQLGLSPQKIAKLEAKGELDKKLSASV